MCKPIAPQEKASEGLRYSALREAQRVEALGACRELTDSIFAGLDVTDEIASVASQSLGETVLVYDNSRLAGFAICHCGGGTEAGSGGCYIKFGVVRPGNTAKNRMDGLLDACGALAFERGLERLSAGMNL